MHTLNTPEVTTPAVAAKQVEVAEGLFVLELEERLEMAAVAASDTIRCWSSGGTGK